jgi:endonuclease YncB( thermonuclease family)
VRIDLGFDLWTKQTLRLRGIDCMEMDTTERLTVKNGAKKYPNKSEGAKEGQAAKAFLQSYIKEADQLLIRSSKSDKYDRYLADVFIPPGEDLNPQADIYLR